jgi:hypothetical protein
MSGSWAVLLCDNKMLGRRRAVVLKATMGKTAVSVVQRTFRIFEDVATVES